MPRRAPAACRLEWSNPGPTFGMRHDFTPTDDAGADGRSRLVWDLPLRVCHWGLALAVGGSFVTHWIGMSAFPQHVFCGCAVLVLVLFRIAWGFVGPAHARFADFMRGPRAVIASLVALRGGRAPRFVGHTPAGGWMILALLVLLALQAGCGLFANDEVSNTGPLFGYLSQDASDTLSYWHRLMSNLILAAVSVHVAAALYYRRVLGLDLIAPLVTGRKRDVPAALEIADQRIGVAIAIVVLLAALLASAIATAPQAPLVLM